MLSTLLISLVPAVAAESTLPPLGINQGGVADMKNAGTPVMFGSSWVGQWTASSGWSGPENALKSAKASGVTPVVYWYYWGDAISPSCVESGCEGRSKAQWDSMSRELADRIRSIMGGSRTIVVLENEFNKGGITDTWYAPTFDGYLEAKANLFHQVPGVEVVLGFGTWGEDAWERFPRAIAASDTIGFQMMRASTRDSESVYRGASDRIASVLTHIREIHGKGAFLYDLALSSYPAPYWEGVQAETLRTILERLPEYQSNGLQGIVYREVRDNPYMGTGNYYGVAEQHWGLRGADGRDKPAVEAWRVAYNLPPPPPPAPNVPGTFEGEAMQATGGGRATDGAASGGALWNLWTNAELRQQVVSEAAQTYRVAVTARGNSAGGVDARMEIRVDGQARAAFGVASTGLATYAANIALPAGAATLAVAFTNDAVVNGQDRNLLVDKVSVSGANRAPVASFAVSGSDLSWRFDASGSVDPDGDALSYAWTFGDGATATGEQVTHKYAGSGTRTVTLTVSDGALKGTTTRTVTATAPVFTASFRPHGGNEWWVQTAVTANEPLKGVCASVNGGACQALELRSWGAWAASFHAPTGSKVVFTATSADGDKVTSPAYMWPSGEEYRPFSAEFNPRGNEWWIQTPVKANKPVASVCATVDGGKCNPLKLQDWGEWAASFRIPKGSTVVVTATSTSGEKVSSAPVRWP